MSKFIRSVTVEITAEDMEALTDMSTSDVLDLGEIIYDATFPALEIADGDTTEVI